MHVYGATFGKTKNNYFQIFNDNVNYVVTKFQRTYTWDERQIKGLIDDFKYINETKEDVSYQTIILQEKPKEDPNPNILTYDIGDGQQRLISFTLALLALYHCAKDKEISGQFSEPELNDSDLLVNSLLPKKTKGKAILGRREKSDRGRNITKPLIRFQSKSTNDAFKLLYKEELEEDDWDKILEDNTSNINVKTLYNAFSLFHEYFSKTLNTIQDIEKYVELILTKINLSVTVYTENENMTRAFSNMNSFGKPLKENELVKAILYGNIRSVNEDLSEVLADYWTENLETEWWKAPSRDRKIEGRTKLDYFLEQSYYSYGNWNNKITQVQDEHWLKKVYLEKTQKQEDFSAMWECMKEDIKVFNNSLCSVPAGVAGTREWITNYANQIIHFSGKDNHFPSFLMKLNRDIISDEEYTNSLWLILDHYFYTHLAKPDLQPHFYTSHALVASGAFNDTVLSLKTLKNYLERTVLGSYQWRDKDHLKEILRTTPYPKDGQHNPLINELFVYMYNKKQKAANSLQALFNSRTISNFDAKSSREHILPRNPKHKEEMSEDEKLRHDRNVELIGNSLTIASDKNSQLNNKDPKDKIIIYSKLQSIPGFDSEIVSRLQKVEKWGIEEIRQRTIELADEIAEILANDNPNYTDKTSKFHELLAHYNTGSKFYIMNGEDLFVELELTREGKLADKTRKLAYSEVKKLREDNENYSKKGWKDIICFKSGDKYIPLSERDTKDNPEELDSED